VANHSPSSRNTARAACSAQSRASDDVRRPRTACRRRRPRASPARARLDDEMMPLALRSEIRSSPIHFRAARARCEAALRARARQLIGELPLLPAPAPLPDP
jgi:hypothetical protein